MSSRTFHDPLHRSIRLDGHQPAEAMVLALVDSRPFQRLRRIRQLGPAFLTFHGAESSRFTHSLGVFHLARQACDHLTHLDPSLHAHRGVLYASALLHDLGHGPLSHTGEEMFGLQHEQWSARLVRHHPEIRAILDLHAPDTAAAVADLLEHGKAARHVIKALVSSQLDCDRLDYLLRDSYSTGTRYGQLDLERILSALTLAPDGELAIHPKGLMAVEHYLVVRNLMYRSVYNHRLNVVCNWLLQQLIRTARQLGPQQVWSDPTMARWLWAPQDLDLESFLANDDLRTGYHLQRWSEEAPAPLAELCQRFLHRRLLKAMPVNQLCSGAQLELLALARQLAEQEGLDPALSCGLRHQQLRGYHPYRGGLRLWDGHHLQALEQCSALVSSLSDPEDTAWLIHPSTISNPLQTAMLSIDPGLSPPEARR
jgi:HD superfamily phosphohydrolase